MTSRKLLVYYSLTGNTRAMLPYFEILDYDIVDISKVETLAFDNYDIIVFGTSTWGRGIPPKPFFKFRDEIAKIENKTIGLFGSGRSEYQFYCGALDLLEELLKDKNIIQFKYKYEGYPRKMDFVQFKMLLEELTK